MVINEIHYHPPVDGHEFLELHNVAATPADLGGACFTAGITGCFAPGTTVAPGGFVVVAESLTAYAQGFPGAPAPAFAYRGALSNSGERLTLAHGSTVVDTVAYTDTAPWPLSPDGGGPSLELIDPLADNDTPAAWAASDPAPTPGAPNTQFGLGPLPEIGAVTVGPVAAGAPVTITADVTGASAVTLEVVIGPGSAVQEVPMLDDGAHGDGAPGDGRHGAVIAGRPANTLVRYRVVATAGSARATVPANGDSRPRLGFVVAPPAPTTPLPVLQWFIDPADYDRLLARRHTNDYVPAIIASGTEVWDGAEVRVQGNNRVGPKLSFKVKMPRGHDLVAPGLVPEPVDEFVLDGDPRDALGINPLLGFDVYDDGNPLVPQLAKVRVHRNGSFFGMYTFIEEFERNWMTRAGLDRPGTEVYEPKGVDGVFVDEGNPDALVPRFDKLSSGSDYTTLYELTRVIDGLPTPERAAALRDHFDVPALVDYLATGAVLQHWDQTVHNFVLIRDGATGRWRFGPADLDWILGQPVTSTGAGYRAPALFPYGPDNLVSALRADPVFGELYLRRLRTLADTYLAGGVIQRRADALAPVVAADFAADRAAWGTMPTQAQGRTQLTRYLGERRTELLTTRRLPGEVPAAPTPGRQLVVSEIAYAATGGPGGDFVELHNPATSEALDLSGWSLRGAASAELPPGTVIPAGGYLVVPGDPTATAGGRPSGTLVAGTLAEGVADAGGTIEIVDATGAGRGSVTFATTAPWPTAPASGAATLERIDPASGATGAQAWRASPAAAGSPGSSGNPPAPAPAHRLAVDAVSDQSELTPGNGAGAAITVTVTNTGTASRPSVTTTAPDTTCGRTLGTLAPGEAFTYRCTTLAGSHPDRTFLVTASSAPATATSAPIRIRTLRHFSQYLELYVPAAPTAPTAIAPGDGLLRLTWQQPTNPPQSPLRWSVVTATEPGRSAPTGGALLRPRSSADLDQFPLDRPVQLAVAARNRSGTGPRTAPTPFLTPRASATFPFPDADTAIRRAYQDLDGRQPTAQELTLWRAVLAGGGTPASVVANRLTTPYWTNDVEPVTRLYHAYYGRHPDQAGLQFWIDRRAAGGTFVGISNYFANTTEFQSRYGVVSNSAFVTLVYRNVLGRAPDAGGLRYWTDRLNRGDSRGRIMVGFSESAEGKALLSPRVQVSVVWRAMNRATPTAAQAQPATDWLAAGGSLVTVVEGVRTSDRYAERVG